MADITDEKPLWYAALNGMRYANSCGIPSVNHGEMNEELERYIWNEKIKKVFEYTNSLIGTKDLVSAEEISEATGISIKDVEKILDGLMEELDDE